MKRNEDLISSLPEEDQFQFLVSTASTLASASALNIVNLDNAPLFIGDLTDGETNSVTTIQTPTQQNEKDDSYWKKHEE